MYVTVHRLREPLNDYKCEPKFYLLPEELPFLKQKKSIPSSAVRRDGNGKALLSLEAYTPIE
jgi:hypothetical protein